MSERLNIRRFEIPARDETNEPFDAAKEILPSDIVKMRETMQALLDKNEYLERLEYRALFNQLTGDPPNMVTADQDLFREEADRLQRGGMGEAALYADKLVEGLQLNFYRPLSRGTKELFEDKLAASRAENHKVPSLWLLTRLKQLGMDIQLTDDERDQTNALFSDARIKRDYGQLIKIGAWMRILDMLDPQDLTPEEWRGARGFLQGHRNDVEAMGDEPNRRTALKSFMRVAVNLKILAAESIECTNRGLVIGKPIKGTRAHSNNSAPMPERSQIAP